MKSILRAVSVRGEGAGGLASLYQLLPLPADKMGSSKFPKDSSSDMQAVGRESASGGHTHGNSPRALGLWGLGGVWLILY